MRKFIVDEETLDCCNNDNHIIRKRMIAECKKTDIHALPRELISHLVDEFLRTKTKLDAFDGVQCSVTLSNLAKLEGCDLRITIGPAGSLANERENEEENDDGK
jgi:hypothetical protein